MADYKPNHDVRGVYLSPEAWDGLWAMCPKYRAPKHGVSRLLELLPEDPSLYFDRRPREWKDNDEAMLELGEFPQWSYEYPKLQRNIIITDKTLAKLNRLSEHFAIFPRFHRSHWNKPMPRVNALLEAIGTGLLVIHLDR